MTIRSEKSADFSAFTGTLPYELPTYDFIFMGKPFRMGMDLIIFFMEFHFYRIQVCIKSNRIHVFGRPLPTAHFFHWTNQTTGICLVTQQIRKKDTLIANW